MPLKGCLPKSKANVDFWCAISLLKSFKLQYLNFASLEEFTLICTLHTYLRNWKGRFPSCDILGEKKLTASTVCFQNSEPRYATHILGFLKLWKWNTVNLKLFKQIVDWLRTVELGFLSRNSLVTIYFVCSCQKENQFSEN